MEGSADYPYAELRTLPHGECTAVIPEVSAPVLGDADGDGAVTAADALLVMRFAMSIVTLPPDANCDMDGNGAVDATDAVLIMRRVMNL